MYQHTRRPAPTKGEGHKVPGALAGLLRGHSAVRNHSNEHACKQAGREPGGCWAIGYGALLQRRALAN